MILKETNQKADPKVTPNTSSTVNGKENRTEIAPPALASHYLLRVTPGQDRSRDGRWGIKAGGGEADTREELGADCAGPGRPQGPSGRKGLREHLGIGGGRPARGPRRGDRAEKRGCGRDGRCPQYSQHRPHTPQTPDPATGRSRRARLSPLAPAPAPSASSPGWVGRAGLARPGGQPGPSRKQECAAASAGWTGDPAAGGRRGGWLRAEKEPSAQPAQPPQPGQSPRRPTAGRECCPSSRLAFPTLPPSPGVAPGNSACRGRRETHLSRT